MNADLLGHADGQPDVRHDGQQAELEDGRRDRDGQRVCSLPMSWTARPSSVDTSTSGPIELTVRGSQPSRSRIQRRSIHTKIAVTIENWMAIGTRMPANADRMRSPRRPSMMATTRSVMTTFDGQDLHVGREQLGSDQPPTERDRPVVAAVARRDRHRDARIRLQDRDLLVLVERSAAGRFLILESRVEAVRQLVQDVVAAARGAGCRRRRGRIDRSRVIRVLRDDPAERGVEVGPLLEQACERSPGRRRESIEALGPPVLLAPLAVQEPLGLQPAQAAGRGCSRRCPSPAPRAPCAARSRSAPSGGGRARPARGRPDAVRGAGSRRRCRRLRAWGRCRRHVWCTVCDTQCMTSTPQAAVVSAHGGSPYRRGLDQALYVWTAGSPGPDRPMSVLG